MCRVAHSSCSTVSKSVRLISTEVEATCPHRVSGIRIRQHLPNSVLSGLPVTRGRLRGAANAATKGVPSFYLQELPTAMKSKQLLERSKQWFWRSYRVQGAGAVVLCIGLCVFLIPSHAAGGKLEDRNKAVARAAFFDYLNHRDFKRFEEIHTKDFVKHYNNSPRY